jgi:hypothetical protein
MAHATTQDLALTQRELNSLAILRYSLSQVQHFGPAKVSVMDNWLTRYKKEPEMIRKMLTQDKSKNSFFNTTVTMPLEKKILDAHIAAIQTLLNLDPKRKLSRSHSASSTSLSLIGAIDGPRTPQKKKKSIPARDEEDELTTGLLNAEYGRGAAARRSPTPTTPTTPNTPARATNTTPLRGQATRTYGNIELEQAQPPRRSLLAQCFTRYFCDCWGRRPQDTTPTGNIN